MSIPSSAKSQTLEPYSCLNFATLMFRLTSHIKSIGEMRRTEIETEGPLVMQ